jgi:hypothetical protein
MNTDSNVLWWLIGVSSINTNTDTDVNPSPYSVIAGSTIDRTITNYLVYEEPFFFSGNQSWRVLKFCVYHMTSMNPNRFNIDILNSGLDMYNINLDWPDFQ